MSGSPDVVALARALFLSVANAVDGERLVGQALAQAPLSEAPTAVLALGKVAFPMYAGARRLASAAPALLIAPATRFPPDLADAGLPANARALVADHPTPSARSLAAAAAARAFVGALTPEDRLLVLLSGGGSALLAEPAAGLSFEDKRATVTAVARGGASIRELNAVRKHLSGIKGGQLARACRAHTRVLALSDVVGNHPGTIASGPFCPDDTTFSEALALVLRLAPAAPAPAIARLRAGAAGELPETPKPGDPIFDRVRLEILAGPEAVRAAAERDANARGMHAQVIVRDTEQDVHALAALYAHAAREALSGPSATQVRALIGNGEPRITVTGAGRGGRATHLALLVARELATLPEAARGRVAFLAAGTDDRDGSADAAGAVVDGGTWARAEAAGCHPAAALAACDSEPPLRAAGALLRGPGTSNLLDLHLLVVAPGN